MRAPRLAAGGLVILALVSAGPRALELNLLRAEGVRISEGIASLDRKAPREAPPPGAGRDARGDPCGAGGERDVKVSNEKDLEWALAAARPGDHIHMADGVYHGAFVITESGTEAQPITLCGSRAAILDNGTLQSGYGLSLRASHWHLIGFTVRNARKGIMADGADHNVLRGLEVYGIGDEGVHFRTFSRYNVLRDSWIHDVGLDTPLYGEAVYIGSARSNWPQHSAGKPDACDSNQVLGNVLGPGVSAEGVDAKEGTRGGVISGNLFLGVGATAADSWIDLKCSDYRVDGNFGTFDPRLSFQRPVMVYQSPGGWGEGNVIGEHHAVPAGLQDGDRPYRLAGRGGHTVSLVLPRRTLPYRFPELVACFPQAIEVVSPGILLLHEHLLAGPGTRLVIHREDVHELRLRSEARSFATVIGVRGEIAIEGSEQGRILIRSWDPRAEESDHLSRDGRAFVTIVSGRMDMDLVELSDLGFGTGWASGAAWKGRPGEKSHGNVSRSRFERNHFGAYTFESDSMRWTDNVFANNDIYGFDPHDNSDWFVVTGNQAFGHPRHGIIFSRGCRGNIVRGNSSFSNRGHGIMFDDGKVLDDGNPRHIASIAPVANVIEDNEVWGNEVGIALQGCVEHIVRSNRIRDNRFGIRLDQSDRNILTDNTLLRSKEFAVHLIGGSDSNRVVGNHIQGGQGGIVLLDSRHNVIQDNAISGIIGQGIKVVGNTGAMVLERNRIIGRGSRAIDMREAEVPQRFEAGHNVTAGWMSPRQPYPALTLWGTILGIPVLASVFGRRRRVPRRGPRPPVGLAVLALLFLGAGSAEAAGQRLSLTASFSAVHDDNVFKYSDTQLRDIATGTTPYRYGISEPGDMVVGPSLALLWQQDMENGRRRSIRLRGDGTLYSTNAAANFGEIEGTWREHWAGVRRLTLDYGYSPDRLLRKLYDSDLTSLPSTERYRDARYDAHGGSVAWRHEVPAATWLEWAYQFDRRIYDQGFRERDSDFHTLQAGLGWEELGGGGSLHLTGSHLWRLARAEDGDPGQESDLSYHGPELGVDGRFPLRTFGSGWLFGDAAYTIERRVHDSKLATDLANFGREDLVQSIELGVGLEAARRWAVRGFYRLGWCRANLATNAPLDAELGSYDQNQFGLTLEWTRDVQHQP